MSEPVERIERVILPPSPGDWCRHAERCGVEQLACEAFTMFAAGESMPRWRAAPRAPTRARWEAIFG